MTLLIGYSRWIASNKILTINCVPALRCPSSFLSSRAPLMQPQPCLFEVLKPLPSSLPDPVFVSVFRLQEHREPRNQALCRYSPSCAVTFWPKEKLLLIPNGFKIFEPLERAEIKTYSFSLLCLYTIVVEFRSWIRGIHRIIIFNGKQGNKEKVKTAEGINEIVANFSDIFFTF